MKYTYKHILQHRRAEQHRIAGTGKNTLSRDSHTVQSHRPETATPSNHSPETATPSHHSPEAATPSNHTTPLCRPAVLTMTPHHTTPLQLLLLHPSSPSLSL